MDERKQKEKGAPDGASVTTPEDALRKLLFFWAEYTSQEMYGEHLREGLGGDFEAWNDAHDAARAVLSRSDVEDAAEPQS